MVLILWKCVDVVFIVKIFKFMFVDFDLRFILFIIIFSKVFEDFVFGWLCFIIMF